MPDKALKDITWIQRLRVPYRTVFIKVGAPTRNLVFLVSHLKGFKRDQQILEYEDVWY